MNVEPYRVLPEGAVDLRKLPTRVIGGISPEETKQQFKQLGERFAELQELMYARAERSLLVIFQAMDAGGKDSATRKVFRPLDPAGIRVKSFKAPSPRELRHDFLWRIHAHVPPKGFVAVFNRSHYEDIVAVRVRQLVEPRVWQARFHHINAFERLLVDEGTIVLKFFLHISKKYQKERLQRRLDREDKRWKFNPEDLDDRALWDQYMVAYNEAIGRCSTEAAPWYVVPAECRPTRDLVILQAIVGRLETLHMRYPQPQRDLSKIKIT